MIIQNGIKIVLASASPRRKEILSRLENVLEIAPQNIEEITAKTAPQDIVMALSALKIGELPRLHPDKLCLAADTIVWSGGAMVGKPKNVADARKILSELSGAWHEVYTGLTVAYKGRLITDYERSRVRMNALSLDAIDEYIATGSPLDKAGAYGIQDKGIVSEYDGDYDNIVGLPFAKFCEIANRIVQDIDNNTLS